jgi:hypothetical protein
MPQHEPPGLGQGCLAGTRPPLDKPRLEEAFERVELLAHPGLAVTEPARRGSHRPLIGDGSQSDQVAQLDARPSKGLLYIFHCK